jgi:hypothetical protein
MAGLRLMTALDTGANYTPSTPASASRPGGKTSIGTKAFGINATGASYGPRTAAVSVTTAGIISTAALLFIWWSLPR